MTSESDWTRVGDNVRLMRSLMKLSQIDLAQRAGVERSTVQRVESGKAIRRASYLKLCQGLGADPDEIWQMTRSFGPTNRKTAAVHEAAQSIWYAYEDKRSRVPEDNEERIQSLDERKRLGALGFVTRFRSYLHFVMMQGPGIFIVEVHGPFADGVETGAGGVYQDWILYVLYGPVKVNSSEGERILDTGGALGFRSGYDFSLDRVSAEGDPPRVMFIGANRRKG